MSQAVNAEESSLEYETLHEESTLFSGETYAVTVNNPEEVRDVQAYVRENPETTVFLDYQMDVAISRGANEKSNHFDNGIEYSRILGGMTEHIDQGSYGVITSDGCYQDFKAEIAEETDEALESDISVQNKDIFLSGSSVDEQPKIVGTGIRMDDPEHEKIYGAIWREQGPSTELKQVIDDDVIDISSEEYEKSTYPIKENTGESLWNSITNDLEEASIETLLEDENVDAESHDIEGSSEPLSCPVHIGADTTDKNTPGWDLGEIVKRKQRTS